MDINMLDFSVQFFLDLSDDANCLLVVTPDSRLSINCER